MIHDSPEHLDTICLRHQAFEGGCLLWSMGESEASSTANSVLVLDLSPTILSSLGPAIGDIGFIPLTHPYYDCRIEFRHRGKLS